MYNSIPTERIPTEEMKPETRKVLQDVVEFLNTFSPEAKKLWWVLTALRGPDNESVGMKGATTAVIRYAVGLDDEVGNGATVHGDLATGPELRAKLNDNGREYHFKIHNRMAFEALGLSWEDRNPSLEEKRRLEWQQHLADLNNQPFFGVDLGKIERDVVQYVVDKEPTK